MWFAEDPVEENDHPKCNYRTLGGDWNKTIFYVRLHDCNKPLWLKWMIFLDMVLDLVCKYFTLLLFCSCEEWHWDFFFEDYIESVRFSY